MTGYKATRSIGACLTAYRRTALETKVGGAIAQVEHLQDYKKCFQADEQGVPVMSSRDFERFIHLTNDKHIAAVQKFHERTLEYDNFLQAMSDNHSHVITAMLILHPDITAPAFKHAKGMVASLAEAGYNIAPFLSLNDFSYVSSLYRNELPRILGEKKMTILISAMQQEFGPEDGWQESGLPFCEVQTDRAARIIHRFLLERKDDIRISGSTSEKENIDRINAMLHLRNGKGLEFEFAEKDLSFLTLGDKMADCTAFSVKNQMVGEGQNLKSGNKFPRVPLWLASPNVQTLVAYHNDRPYMKMRFFIGKLWGKWTLVFDEFTVTPQARYKSKDYVPELAVMEEPVLEKGIKFMAAIAKKMGGIPLVFDTEEGSGRPFWVQEKYRPLKHEILSMEEIDWKATNEPLREFILANAPEDPLVTDNPGRDIRAFSILNCMTSRFMVRLDGGDFSGEWHNKNYW